MRKYVVALLVLLSNYSLTQAEDKFEFPKGVPYKAREVTWYEPTEYCQNGQGGWKHLSNQSWNQERPWINAGMENSSNATMYKFRRMGSGKLKEWTETERFFGNGGYYRKWSYPKGTVFGELIKADSRTVEIFTLEFTGEEEPVFHRYRPFGKRSEIAKFIVNESMHKIRYADRERRQPENGLVNRFGEPVQNDPHVIDVETIVPEIELTQEGINEVLSRPFRDVIDVPFTEKGGKKAYSFSTKQRNSLVPVDSKAALFSSTSCLTCHRTAGKEGRPMDPRPREDLYGAIRGGNYVFSHNIGHPVNCPFAFLLF